ncbi:MAG: hypothetical protein ACRDVZ_14690, partial [Jiangellaceae bacterium]
SSPSSASRSDAATSDHHPRSQLRRVGIAHSPRLVSCSGEEVVAVTADAAFEPVTEVTADDRARIAFGRIGIHRGERFLVSRRSSGEILLTPLASIPKRELIIWENHELRASLLRGLEDVVAGDVEPMDDLLEDEA